MNLLNLIGATLLAVSPIHEPKNVEIPSDTILQKVEYLDYNIISTSYILIDTDVSNNIFSYYLNLSDSKDLNVDLFYVITQPHSSSIASCNLLIYDNIFDNEVSVDFDTTFEFLHNNFESYLLDDSFLTVFLRNDLENGIMFSVDSDLPVVSNSDLGLQGLSLDYRINHDNLSYYNNILNSFNEDSLSLVSNSLGYDNIFNYFLTKYLFTIESGPITDGIFDIVGNTVENYVTTITNLFSRVIALFYVDSKLTILGVLMVFTFGIGIVKFGFNLIKDLLRL